MNFFRFIRN